MKEGKEFLRRKLIEFQVRIADLDHTLGRERDSFHEKEKAFRLGLLDILDAFETIEETIEAKKDRYDKSARMLSKNIRAVHRKLTRLMKSDGVIKMDFPGNRASMDRCKVLDVREAPEMENETILTIVKNGYINKKDGSVLRKAEVITVSNNE